MHIAMSNALALILWHDSKILHRSFIDIGPVWLLVGFLLAIVLISALAAEAALVLRSRERIRTRFRWPDDLSEFTIPTSQARGTAVSLIVEPPLREAGGQMEPMPGRHSIRK
jgi:hypothetical protein